MVRHSRRYTYTDLRYLIQETLEGCPEFGHRVEVDGKINRIAEGLWHDNYWFWIRGPGLSAAQTGQAYVLRLLDQEEDWQAGPEPKARLIREAETLRIIENIEFAHSTPHFISFVQDADQTAIGMIETALSGHSMDKYKDQSTLRLVGRVAADVHRLEIKRFPHLSISSSRTEDLKSQISELDESMFAEFPLANDVREWGEAYVPSDESSCILHGDLLPQNLICDWPATDDENSPVGVIDWEMARVGDPAYDLAIVSRGNRKVLGVKDGLKILVNYYLECGGQKISLTDVHAHELLLALYWLEEAWREYQKPDPRGHGPDFYEAKLKSLLRRVAC